ncbi:MAG: DUF86 domain-containing protein [bacterium]|nr:DUF86 domain-containing protein [bacterium]
MRRYKIADYACVEYILKACGYIQKFVEDIDFDQFLKDEKTSSAVIQKFEIIGEAAKNVPEFIKEKYPHVAWKNMAGMRDRLIHGYFGIDYFLVWDTIKSDIPKIIYSTSQILEDIERESVSDLE